MATIDDVLDRWKKAESVLKKVEAIRRDVTVSALNELRYAGYHTALSISPASDAAVRAKAVDDAYDHCRRAGYDACDAGIMYYLARIDRFSSDYQLVPIIPVVPDYLEFRRVANDVSQAMANVPHDGREQYFDKAAERLEELGKIDAVLTAAREELNKASVRRRAKSVAILATLLIAAVGSGAAGASAYFAGKPELQKPLPSAGAPTKPAPKTP